MAGLSLDWFGSSDTGSSDSTPWFASSPTITTSTNPTKQETSSLNLGSLFTTGLTGALDLGKTWLQMTGLVDATKAQNSNSSTLQADPNSGIRVGNTYITYGLIALAGVALVGGVILFTRRK